MSLHRNCPCTQKGACSKRGQGVGGVFHSLYNKLIPIPKNTGEKLLSSPEAEESLRAIRNSAIDAGLNMVTDTVERSGAKKTITPARKDQIKAAAAAAAVDKQPSQRKAGKRTAAASGGGGSGGGGGAGKVSRKERDVFDDEDILVDDQ